MEKPTASLDRVQRWMQAVITHPHGVDEGVASENARSEIADESAAEQLISSSAKLPARRRLGIYANAYYARLLECLESQYRVFAKAVGKETFSAFAFGYLRNYPSQSYTLGRLGDHFARYLDETRPDAPEMQDWIDLLVDLARLEWTIWEVFDGEGTEVGAWLRPDSLQNIQPDAWPATRLRVAPCVRLMQSRFPIGNYYVALRKDEPPPPPEPKTSYLVISRQNYVVKHWETSHGQFVILQSLKRGDSVGLAIERAFEEAKPAREQFANELRQWFHDWTAEGLFIGIRE